MRSTGVAAESIMIFRVRFMEGIPPADRIAFDGHEHDVKETWEIGRRRGLEIRATSRKHGS
ncbi:head-tail adaptor protein [Microvirga aerophila]|uniref:Head-tail adaptor protein n=1 Tax=Microvirga aerophila TaxID=670291 RepID=A0A512C545_9HYPH|nr:head-tail adaptor protein [Microvirga aerophila]GEO19321.1 hypothetical protein MAE02_70170 [Microvirga aerophila]